MHPGQGSQLTSRTHTASSPSLTHRNAQDGRLDRGPFVLPPVYDQDKPDAGILQAASRRQLSAA